MPTYISLVRFTDQGVHNIKESPKRLDATKQAFKGLGGELRIRVLGYRALFRQPDSRCSRCSKQTRQRYPGRPGSR